jgi:type I restriction enzyme S subunit
MHVSWQTRKLADVCEIKPPKVEARRRLADTDSVSFVPMEDLGIDQKFLVPTQTRPLTDVAGSYTYFADGDVLLAKITPCFENGKLGIAADLTNGIGFGSSEYIVFRPDASVDKEWLYYFLAQPRFRDEGAERMSGAVGHKRVAKDFIEGYPIPIPPLPEQRRIVGILDEAFEGIATAKANAEKNLQNARALFESHLQSVLTQFGEKGARVRIEDACDSVMDCVNKTAPKVDGPTPFKMIRTTNVRNGLVSLDSVNYVTENVYRVWTRRQVPKPGDVILTREAPMGEVGMLLSDDNVFLGQRLVSYRANPAKLNNRFLLYALQSGDLQRQIRALASGSTVQHMRVPDSKNLQLPLPGLREQEETVATLDSLRADTDRLASIYQQKLAALDELKKSLLHQAFSGEL